MEPTTRSYGLSVRKAINGYTVTTVTPALSFTGGGTNELMTGTRKWNSGMVARGSIYVANDNKVYAFRVPGRNAYANAYSNCCVHSHCYRDCDSNGNCNSNIYTNCHCDCDEPRQSVTPTPTATASASGSPTATPRPIPTPRPHTTPRPRPTPPPRPGARVDDQVAHASRVHVSAPSPKTGATRQSDTERESPRSSAREGACGPPKRK